MALTNLEAAQYPSYQEFLAFSKQQDNHPSFGNLFSVHFASPRVLQNSGNIQGGSKTTNLISETGDLSKLLNFYCIYHYVKVEGKNVQILNFQTHLD